MNDLFRCDECAAIYQDRELAAWHATNAHGRRSVGRRVKSPAFQVGDFVTANSYAATYYPSSFSSDHPNSDFNRRTLQLGRVLQVSGDTIEIHDEVRDLRLAMKADTLQGLDVTWIIDEQMFDFPQPTYHHF